MKFLDLTGELLAKVDFERSRIVLPQKLVFVCGGQMSSNSAAPTSMREVLLEKAYAAGKLDEIGGAKVLLAEAAVNALAETSFKNLLELETYIAAVVQAIILIVESPGSICELGAFVMVPEISSKLIVVLQGKYKNIPSFITNGAIKFFKEHEPDSQVHGYEWEIDPVTKVISAPTYATDAMLEEIPAAIQNVHSAHAKVKIDTKKIGHLIYLVLAFCHLLRAAKLIDIKRCFEFSRIDVDELKIKHCLETLIICKLMTVVSQAKLEYYIALVETSPLRMRFLPGTAGGNKSQSRWQTRIKDLIEEEAKLRNEMFVGHRHA